MPMQLIKNVDSTEDPTYLDDVEFFDDSVPSFAEHALESLYECVMSTLLRFSQHYPLETAKTYVSYKSGAIAALFIYRIDRSQLVIYNEQIYIGCDELERFAKNAFSKYPTVSRLSFYAIDIDTDCLRFPHQCVECLEDIWLKLPQKPSEYTSSLGKKTLETIRRAEKKLRRDHPSFEINFLSKEDVNIDDIIKIILLNGLRMEKKGTTHYHTEESVPKLIGLVRKYGLVGVALVNGVVCGGIIQLHVGSHWFSHTISHDPNYDSYRLGQLCNYYGVLATIDNGGGVFHFGWGRSEHKYRMGGIDRALFKLEIYRGPQSMLADVPGILNRVITSQRRRLKLWIAEHERAKVSKVARMVRFLRIVRSGPVKWLNDRTPDAEK
jgi:hypothetical protein